MEKEVINVLNWKEKIIVKIFSKTFKKVYKLGMVDCFNFISK